MSGESVGAWVCSVCGYVHREAEPPDECPVCGAPKDAFEPYEEPVPAAQKSGQVWCLICGYVHDTAEAPEACPVCGASPDEFAPHDAGASSAQTSEARVIVIVGAGIAGLSAAENARQTCPNARITLVSKEKDLPYYRLNLTRYLAGEVDESILPVRPEAWFEENEITLLRGAEVTGIDTANKSVTLDSGPALAFDKLILACGAHPFIPPFHGAGLDGVTTVRTVADANALLARIRPGMRCVCIGGGILGLETAGALTKRGLEVSLLEGFGWLLPRQLDEAGARVLERAVKKQGLRIVGNARTTKICGDARAEAVLLEDGSRLPADLVTITTGVRPNTSLARQAGLEVNKGVVVNSRLTTSHPDIYAAGDVAEHRGTLYGLWEPARYQGAIAGMNAAGLDNEFGGLPRTNTLKVLGVDMFSIGLVEPDDASFTEIAGERNGHYYRFLFRDGVLAGAILVGDTHAASGLAQALKNRRDCSALLAKRPGVEEAAEFFAGVT